MVRGAIGKQRSTLQGAGSGFEGKRVGAPCQIKLGKFGSAARAEVERLRHRAVAGSPEPLSFEAQTVADGISPSLIHEYVYGLRCLTTFGILRGDGHTAEYSQVVEATLRFHDSAFT